jgi:osmotically-inducible protein OsmY
MTHQNDELIAAIRTKLEEDPRIPAPDAIAVEAYGADVILRGTVGSFPQARAAVNDARRTRGTVDVSSELSIRILKGDRREDAEIEGAALQRLIWDPEIPADYIDVSVKDGWVTLRGEIDHQYESDYAFDRVASLRGVTGVTNHLKVTQALYTGKSDS